MDTHATTDVPALGAPSAAGPDRRASSAWSLGALGAVMNPDQFFRSWLIGFLFCLGLSLGSLALLMLQHLSGGQWGLVGRRIFEAGTPHPAVCRAAVHSDRCFGCRRSTTGREPGGRGRRRHPAEQGRLPERRRSSSAARSSTSLVWMVCVDPAERVVGGAGPRRGRVDRGDTRRFRVVSAPGLLVYVLIDEPRGDRLDHVARPALVLDDLRLHLRRRAGAGGVRVRHRRARDAGHDASRSRRTSSRGTSTTSASCCSRS